tara:strand:+ start:753 stop:1142 length:390 start_codon:yes stop_codon:yes gene_type:complete
MAIAYWVGIYIMTAIPTLTTNYLVNITWMTIVIPNLLRFMVSSIPRLAVDRVFFMASTVIAFVLTFILNKVFSDTKEAIEDSTVDNSKKLKMSALLVGTFTAGALITYFMGIDTSIYSNMGWENQGLTM